MNILLKYVGFDKNIYFYTLYDWIYKNRDDYNSLTSDISQTILLNVQPLIHYLSDAMYGCPIKLGANMAINGFCLIISENL